MVLERLPFLKMLFFIIPGLITGIIVGQTFTLLALTIVAIVTIISLLFKRIEVVFVATAFGCGLLASIYFLRWQDIHPTSSFTSAKSMLFGTVTNVYSSDSSYFRLRLEGDMYLFSKKYPRTTVLLSAFAYEENLPQFSEGDIILCFADVRPPRKPSLPTEIDEPRIARLEEVQLFGKTHPSKIIKRWANPTTFYSFQIKLRNYLKAKVEQIFSERNAGIFLAVLLGDRSKLHPETRIIFATTGLSHILALSGFHIGIVILIALFLFGFVKNKWLRLCLIAIFLVVYLIAIGSPPSAVRASTMALAFLYAQNLERKTELLNLLAFLLICILLAEPSMLFSIGFQLSFLAVLSIALFGKTTDTFLWKLFPSNVWVVKAIRSLFSVTISAQILTAPAVAYYFGYFTFISFLANIIIVPLFILAIIYGFSAIVLSLFSVVIGKAIAFPADFLIDGANIIAEWLANQLSYLVIRNNELLMLSLLITLTILFIVYSRSILDFFLRFAVGIVVILTLIYQFQKIPSPQVKFCPRGKYVAIFAKDSERVVCLLLDRRPHFRPSRDLAMERFLSSLKGKLKIGVSGNVGIAIADEVAQQRKIDVFEVSSRLQRALSQILFQGKNFFKINESIEWK